MVKSMLELLRWKIITKKLNYISALLILVFLTASFLFGCKRDTESDIYWFRDPVGFFHTNDLDRAQEQIPFTIILPTYLPEDMGLDALKIYGPREVNIGDDIRGTEVQISYISGDREIYIDEDDSGQVMHPASDSPVFLDINGMMILKQVSSIEERIGFDWNHDGIRYAVRVYSIDEEEAIKIVKSMIEQL